MDWSRIARAGALCARRLEASRVGLEGLLEDDEGLGEVLFAEDVGDADLLAALAGLGVEAGAGRHHHRGAFVLEVAQAPDAEFLGIVDGELRHRVEGAHRDGRIHAGDLLSPSIRKLRRSRYSS